MKKTALVIAVLSILLNIGVVYASDISAAIYYGKIRATNSLATTTENVSANFTIDTDAWIAAGLVNSSVNNTAIHTTTTTDTAFMPGWSTNPWIVWFESIPGNASVDYTLYTNTTGGKQRYFPGDAGMLIADNATLEISNNGTVEVSGYIDSANGTSKYLALKPDSLSLIVSPTVSGNITAKIGSTPTENFTSYTEVDPGPSLTVTSSNISAVDALANGDYYVYRDYGVNFTGQFDIDFTLTTSEPSTGGGYGGIAITNTVNDISGLAATDVWLTGHSMGANKLQITLGRGNSVATDATANISHGTYYCTLHKDYGDDNVYGYIYSDAAHTTPFDTLTIAGAGANTYYRYSFGFINNNLGLAYQFSGIIEDMDITLAATSLAGIASGEYDASLTISGNTLDLYVGASNNNTAFYGYAPNVTSNWTFVSNGAMPYVEYAEVTVNGIQQGYWDWEYNTTFDDNVTANSNTAYPSFRTTCSSANISASLISLTPVEIAATDNDTATTWPTITTTPPATPATTYTQNATPGIFFRPIVAEVWPYTGIPEEIFWYNWAFIQIIAAGILVYYFFANNKNNPKDALLIKIIVMASIMTFFALPGPNIYGLYVVIYFALWSVGILIISRSYGW